MRSKREPGGASLAGPPQGLPPQASQSSLPHPSRLNAPPPLLSVLGSMEPIHEATHRGDLEAVQGLVGMDPALILALDAQGKVPLLIAAREGHPLLVAYILDQLAPRKKINLERLKWRALVLACVGQHGDVVEVLLQKGADPTMHDSEGNTVLVEVCNRQIFYAEQGERVVASLLAWGVNPNGGCRTNVHPPLHLACRHDHAWLVKLLLEAGANPTLPDTQGRTPLDVAKQCLKAFNPILHQLEVSGLFPFTAGQPHLCSTRRERGRGVAFAVAVGPLSCVTRTFRVMTGITLPPPLPVSLQAAAKEWEAACAIPYMLARARAIVDGAYTFRMCPAAAGAKTGRRPRPSGSRPHPPT